MLWAQRTQFSNHVLLPTALITALSIPSLRGRFGNPVLSEPHSTCLLSRAESVHFGGDQAGGPFGGHSGPSPILPPNRDHSFFALTDLAVHIVVHSIFGRGADDGKDPLLALSTDRDDSLLRRILVGDRDLVFNCIILIKKPASASAPISAPAPASASAPESSAACIVLISHLATALLQLLPELGPQQPEDSRHLRWGSLGRAMTIVMIVMLVQNIDNTNFQRLELHGRVV